MKRLLKDFAVAAFSFAAFFLLVQVCYGYEKRLGVITTFTDAGSANNQNTASSFPLSSGAPLAVQCDSDACVAMGVDSGTVTACGTAANGGVHIGPGMLFDVPAVGYGANAVDTLAAGAYDGGVANCVVFQVVTP